MFFFCVFVSSDFFRVSKKIFRVLNLQGAICECFQKLGENPQNGWWKEWNILLKWMIWGYPYFWKHSCVESGLLIGFFCVFVSSDFFRVSKKIGVHVDVLRRIFDGFYSTSSEKKNIAHSQGLLRAETTKKTQGLSNRRTVSPKWNAPQQLVTPQTETRHTAR